MWQVGQAVEIHNNPFGGRYATITRLISTGFIATLKCGMELAFTSRGNLYTESPLAIQFMAEKGNCWCERTYAETETEITLS